MSQGKKKSVRFSISMPAEMHAAAMERVESLGQGISGYIAAIVRNDLIRPSADLIVRAARSVKR